MDCVFEVVDSSDEERYYSLGVFLEEAAAMALLEGAKPPHFDGDSDAVTLEVRRRPLGLHPHCYPTLARRTWVRNFSEGGPEWSAQTTRPVRP